MPCVLLRASLQLGGRTLSQGPSWDRRLLYQYSEASRGKKKNHRSGSNLSKGKGLLVNGQLAYLFCKAQNLCLAIVAWAKADKGEETLPSRESN